MPGLRLAPMSCRLPSFLVVGALIGIMAWMVAKIPCPARATGSQSCGVKAISRVEANTGLQRPTGCFVPNLGQWDHPARFVHRSGPMTLFLEERGWVVDLVERPARPEPRPHERGPLRRHPGVPADEGANQRIRGVALRMTFEGTGVPEIAGENKLPGYHSYFLGNDQSRWHTHVPLYGSVHYEGLYPGIDLNVREDGVPEYDLILEPGADLSQVTVRVDGGQALRIAGDGSLIIESALGPLIQRQPKTWQAMADGEKREVACRFVLLGPTRFGFEAPDWDGDARLVIDPGLLWSTFLGGNGWERAEDVAVDSSGMVTVVGETYSATYPTTTGAYDTTHNGPSVAVDAFVSRLDPRKVGAAQLLYSTFLGGDQSDQAISFAVAASGTVTVGGHTRSTNFPTTGGAYDTTHNGGNSLFDVFVTRIDPSRTGAAQLAYSTFLGGSSDEFAYDLTEDASGMATLCGRTLSTNFPTTSGAYSTIPNDIFVVRLDPNRTASAQLVYSTFFGGSLRDTPFVLSVDTSAVVTLAGQTFSYDFPMTAGTFDATFNGKADAFVSRLDLKRTAKAQLVYSTYLGGADYESTIAVHVDAGGVVTVGGGSWSANYPTTSNAYETNFSGRGITGIISRLDPTKTGKAQLLYSTLFGQGGGEAVHGLFVDTSGVVTVAGSARGIPTTSGAYDTTRNGRDDAFVSRLDPSKARSEQLLYSTFLGGSNFDHAWAMAVDLGGAVMVAGLTNSSDFPTTSAAFDTTWNYDYDLFVSRLDMGVALYGDAYEVSLSAGGTQKLTVNAGKAHANKSYWIFGSVTGTTPGVTLGSPMGSVNIPLNPDIWTDYTIALPNTATLTNTKAMLDASGSAQASLNIPKVNLPSAIGLVFHHAYLVYDAKNNFYMASNAVPLRLVK